MVLVFLCLAYFTSIMIFRSIHIVTNDRISFFFWLNSIPSSHVPHFIISWWTQKLFPLRVNSAAVNVGVQKPPRHTDSIPLALHPAEGLPGHMVSLFFIFLRNLHTVLHNGSTNISTNVCKDSLSSTSSLYLLSSVWLPCFEIPLLRTTCVSFGKLPDLPHICEMISIRHKVIMRMKEIIPVNPNLH
jgi:hypothetical protein